ncbi:MAG: histidinol-phosphatase [Gemmatimonadota bacterium]|nr:histidinol-phosphatase [Gemmatimonadota bacterium]
MTLLLDAVAEVARVAGDTALHYFRSAGLTVEPKRDGTPVTVADRAAEQAARGWLRARFPDDGILGEELGEERPGARRRWVLDPIDGTKTFVRGVPLWGSLVAVHEGETILAGAIYCPAVGELVAAAPGAGCWWNGSRCAVSAVSDLADATILTTGVRFAGFPARGAAWRELAERVAVSRTWGDCYGYLLVATGRAELMTDPELSPWDAAALLPVITEAGGVYTDWRGRVTAFGGAGVVATNAVLAEEIRSRLGVGNGEERRST